MLIDCDTCAVRGPACGDCVMTVLLGAAPGGVEVDEADRQALATLAEGGLVPHLRLVPRWPAGTDERDTRGREVS
ncbi:MAG: hypothetical protein NVSMB13_06230 [Mycobacteriales bacterium]